MPTPRLLLLATTVVLLAGCGADPAEPGEPPARVAVTTLLADSSLRSAGALLGPTQLVPRDERTFASAWRLVYGGLQRQPAEPYVDFPREYAVITVPAPTGTGDGLLPERVDSVTTRGGSVTVHLGRTIVCGVAPFGTYSEVNAVSIPAGMVTFTTTTRRVGGC